MQRLHCYVLYHPFTGLIMQAGRGVAIVRDGLLAAEIVGVDHHTIDSHRQKVDLSRVLERGDETRIATLIDIG